MLENLDFELIYAELGALGYHCCQFYAERTHKIEFEIYDKEVSSLHSESGGILIELKKSPEAPVLTFRTNQFSTESVLNILGLKPKSSFKSVPSHPTPSKKQVGKRLQELQQLARKINLENSLIRPASLYYRETHQTYQSLHEPGDLKQGQNEQGELELRIESSFKGKPLNFSHQLSGTSLESLWNQIQNLPGQVKRRIRLGSSEQWPAPQGPMPLGWSNQALAKIAHCFLRGFEGDLVLKNFSYLSQVSLPLECQFTLHENDLKNCKNIDHEGSLRKAMLIFDGKNPKGLATNQIAADQFSVSPTGHARRETFESPSTIGFWNPILTGKSHVESILPLMSEGIWVEEIEIQDLDLIEGTVTLHLSQVNLVHQGEIGESVQPFSWTLPLVDLMGSLKHFSKDYSTTGLFHQKQKQRILTEYTTPTALSLGLPIPGSVPKSHYW